MAQRIKPADVEQLLADAGHRTSEYDPEAGWDPGYRCARKGPGERAVIVLHDGPGQAEGLDAYTRTLRAAGYHVIPDRPQGQRQRLIVTRP